MPAEDLLQRQKKVLVPFLDRAQEIKAVNPKIAYYCQLYALEETVKLGEKNLDPAVKAVIEAVMAELTKTGPSLNLNRAADAVECDKFAKMVFARADKLDRGSGSLVDAAQSFRYAEQFFRVTSQFGPLSAESERLRKYAIWRCLELLKAQKEGRAPVPPPEISGQLEATAEAELMAALGSLPDIPSSSAQASSASLPPAPTAVIPPAPVAVPTPAPHPLVPSAASLPMVHPLRAFVPGQRVKFCPDATGNCLTEEAMVVGLRHGLNGASAYTIQLARGGKTLTVPGELVAPWIKAGEAMVYCPDDGSPEFVDVEEVYASRWPPTYLVKRPGRGLAEVEDDALGLAPAASVGAPTEMRSQIESPVVTDDAAADMAADKLAADAVASAEGDHRVAHDDLSTILEEEPSTILERSVSECSSAAAAVVVADVLQEERGAQQPCDAPPNDGMLYVHMNQAEPSESSDLANALLSHAIDVPPRYQQQQHQELPPPPVVSEPGTVPKAAPVPVAPIPTFYPITGPQDMPEAAPPRRPPAASDLYVPSLETVMEAQKRTKTANSALAFEDVPTAVKYLQQALELLTNPGARQQKVGYSRG